MDRYKINLLIMHEVYTDLENKTKIMEEKQLTFGQKLVGLNFNPSNDDAVSKAKQLCADLADLLHDKISETEISKMQSMLFNHAIGEILNAQMNCVKILTLKY